MIRVFSLISALLIQDAQVALPNAVPLGDPSEWIDSDKDYPMDALIAGHQGWIKVILLIDNKGNVSACNLVSADGWSSLKEVTCPLIKSRARFAPAPLVAGSRYAGQATVSVHWEYSDDKRLAACTERGIYCESEE